VMRAYCYASGRVRTLAFGVGVAVVGGRGFGDRVGRFVASIGGQGAGRVSA